MPSHPRRFLTAGLLWTGRHASFQEPLALRIEAKGSRGPWQVLEALGYS